LDGNDTGTVGVFVPVRPAIAFYSNLPILIKRMATHPLSFVIFQIIDLNGQF
jgi:hypothetical protein